MGVVWGSVVILVARVYVYRETGLSSVRHWTLDLCHLSPPRCSFRETMAIIYYPPRLSVFRASQIFEVLFIRFTASAKKDLLRIRSSFRSLLSFVRRDGLKRCILLEDVRILTEEKKNLRM